MSWKPEVFVEGKWSQNGLVFETEKEAKENAVDLMNRWFLVVDARAVESDKEVNYTYHNRELKMVEVADKDAEATTMSQRAASPRQVDE